MRPTIERVRELLAYAPETGALTWLVANSNRVKAGDRAGGFNEYGYRVVGIDGRIYFATHLAWALMTGEWPEEIDHEDTDPANDKWGNLRLATRAQNQANRHKQSNNTSGFKGVHFHPQSGKWRARIGGRGNVKPLGLHATKEAAHAAYCREAVQTYGEFARAS